MKPKVVFLACFLGLVSAGLFGAVARSSGASLSLMLHGHAANDGLITALPVGLGLVGCLIMGPRGKRRRLASTFAGAVACLFIVGSTFASTACDGFGKLTRQAIPGPVSIKVSASVR